MAVTGNQRHAEGSGKVGGNTSALRETRVTHGSAKTSPTRTTTTKPPLHPHQKKKKKKKKRKKKKQLGNRSESNVSSDSHSVHVVPDFSDTVI